MTTYETNIQALVSKNPQLAKKIFDIKENTRFEVFQTKDPIDINMYDLSTKTAMYEHPIQDVIDFSQKHKDFESYPYRYFYGMANGVAVHMALKAPALKRLILIEPQLELLYITFNLVDFSEAIKSGKLNIETADNINFDKAFSFFNDKESQLYARLFNLEITSKYYDLTDFQTCSLTLSTLTQALGHIITVHGNDATDSLIGVKNHLINLPDMIKGAKFSHLLGKAQGETAIIVSTGPSLTKQLPLLKKIQDHVTIICPDASFPILEKHGIKPDYVTVIERIALTAEFLKKTSTEFQKDVNFICASLIHPETKEAIREGNLYLEMRPHGYTRYFELNDFGYLGQGLSTANLAYELAIVLEFTNVIFIGQDLAYGDDKTSHASDHTFSANEKDMKDEKEELWATGYGKKGKVRTCMVWNIFRNDFESIIEQTKTFLNTINATEGGAHIFGSTEMTFEKSVATYVDMNFKKELVLPELPTNKEHEKYLRQVIRKTNKLFQEASQKQELIEKTFINVQEYSEKLVALSQGGRLEEIDFDYLQSLSDQIDVIKDFSLDETFNLMFFETIRSYLVHQELEFAALYVKPVHNEVEKQLKQVDWVMKHRYWLFTLAGGIDSQRIVMQDAVKTWPSELRDKIVIPDKKEITFSEEKYQTLKNQAEHEQEEREKEMLGDFKNVFDQMGKQES